MKRTFRTLAFCGLILLGASPARADGTRDVGEVSTAWKVLGPDHKIKIEAVEDPKIAGITCYVSRAVKGGIKGALGLAEDTADASVACRQTGPVSYKAPIRARDRGEEVFNERRSILFKTLHVTRFYDAATKTLVYLTWSDRLVDGSPKNAVSAVTPMPWGATPPGEPKLER